jgi:hypothetical protein
MHRNRIQDVRSQAKSAWRRSASDDAHPPPTGGLAWYSRSQDRHIPMLITTELSGQHAVPVDEPADPEVPQRARRRVFSAQYKLKILAEYERRSPVMRPADPRRVV